VSIQKRNIYILVVNYISAMVILFDRFNLPEDIYEIVFATKQQQVVAKILINELKKNKGEIDKTTMSTIATKLHEGEFVTQIDDEAYKGKKIKVKYNKRQFYDRILTPMKSMGLVDYDLYRKTYKISDKFNKELVRIGLKWIKESRIE
jgi:hypothetical protein